MVNEKIIERECTSGPYGDETCSYHIKMSEGMTVARFLAELIKRYPREWGTIYINDKKVCEYRCGVLLFGETKVDINDYMDFFIISATSHGGWGLMDYHLNIGDIENPDYVLGTYHGREMTHKLVKLLDEIQTYGIEVDCKNIIDNKEIALFLLRRGVIL